MPRTIPQGGFALGRPARTDGDLTVKNLTRSGDLVRTGYEDIGESLVVEWETWRSNASHGQETGENKDCLY